MECPLTQLELNCVRWFADGHTAPEIAIFEQRRPAAIHTRVIKARDKTGTATIAGLVAMALRNGWIK